MLGPKFTGSIFQSRKQQHPDSASGSGRQGSHGFEFRFATAQQHSSNPYELFFVVNRKDMISCSLELIDIEDEGFACRRFGEHIGVMELDQFPYCIVVKVSAPNLQINPL